MCIMGSYFSTSNATAVNTTSRNYEINPNNEDEIDQSRPDYWARAKRKIRERYAFKPIATTDSYDSELQYLSQVEYTFENLVFAGGGNRVFAYAGALEVFEKLGMITNFKRFAGCSLGALTAAFVAFGLSSHDITGIIESIREKLQGMICDARYGYFSLPGNCSRTYGWHPSNSVMEWIALKMDEYGSNKNETFLQLYERTGRELCVIVTNISQMCVEYCHPKTTPNLPIIIALRMSISIPLMMSSVKYKLRSTEDVFVDGGLLCNYPIHCFDGWWLSMKPEDCLIVRMRRMEDIPKMFDKAERFGSYNEKTLGMYLFTTFESSLMQSSLNRTVGEPPVVPDTALARKRGKVGLTCNTHRKDSLRRSFSKTDTNRSKTFCRFIDVVIASGNTTRINKEVLVNIFENEQLFSSQDKQELFGTCSVEEVFNILDTDNDGYINHNELFAFAESQGIQMTAAFLGYERQNINGFTSFLGAMLNTITNHAMRVYTGAHDAKRTIGIDTVYVNATDFHIDIEDRDFLYEQGRRGAIAYLKQLPQNVNR